MRRATLATFGALLVVTSAASNCTIPELTSEGLACPCAADYDCDRSTDPNGICRRAGSFSTSSSTGGGAPGTGGTSSSGATAGGGGMGGAGGAGGDQGVGACGGASAFPPSKEASFDGYGCPAVSTPPEKCQVTSKPALCCDNLGPAPALDYPSSTLGTEVGKVSTVHSWFVCWVRGEAQPMGGRIWYLTEVDVKETADWGWVGSEYLLPRDSGFEPEDPPSSLPNCFCPPAP
jgi:hypothetical protein